MVGKSPKLGKQSHEKHRNSLSYMYKNRLPLDVITRTFISKFAGLSAKSVILELIDTVDVFFCVPKK